MKNIIRRKYSLVADHEQDTEGYLVPTGNRSTDEKKRTIKTAWISWPRGTFEGVPIWQKKSIIEHAVRNTEDGGKNTITDKFNT